MLHRLLAVICRKIPFCNTSLLAEIIHEHAAVVEQPVLDTLSNREFALFYPGINRCMAGKNRPR